MRIINKIKEIYGYDLSNKESVTIDSDDLLELIKLTEKYNAELNSVYAQMAEWKLRALQMSTQHSSQSSLNSEARNLISSNDLDNCHATYQSVVNAEKLVDHENKS